LVWKNRRESDGENSYFISELTNMYNKWDECEKLLGKELVGDGKRSGIEERRIGYRRDDGIVSEDD
jgi:hypothetical protein